MRWTGLSAATVSREKMDGSGRRVSDFYTLPGCEEGPPAEWGAVVDRGPSAGGCPGGPYAWHIAECTFASTAAHTSRGSPSITALPPDEGVVLADVDSVRNGRSTSHDRVTGHASAPSDDSRMASMTDSVFPTDTSFAATALRIDDACALHCLFWRCWRTCVAYRRMYICIVNHDDIS